MPLAALAVVAGLLLHYHDRYWYPVDEGNYAHVAQRVAAGEVLNLDVQDIHAGYINFLNAAALRLFGTDMVSLRYPLAFGAFVQACLLYWLIARRDSVLAMIAAISSTALGVVQFVNPTAHWYCGFLTVMLAVWMTRAPKGSSARLLVAGILVGLIGLFRQLTGVWVGMGVLVVALIEPGEDGRGSDTLVSRLVLGALTAILVLYVVHMRAWLGAIMIGSPAAGLLVWALRNTRTANRTALFILIRLAAGTLLAAIPLAAYHLVHGSVGSWWHDVVGSATSMTTLPFFGVPGYAVMVGYGFVQLFTSLDFTRSVNGLYWILVPLLAPANGVWIYRRLRATGFTTDLVFPVLTAFYAIVSLHYEIPAYLYYSASLSIAALLWLCASFTHGRRVVWAVAPLAISLVGVVYHGSQPYRRTWIEVLQGVRVGTTEVDGLERCSLNLDRHDRDDFLGLVTAIKKEVPPGGTIFAIPSDAELYFLADRRNPFRFFNTALGVTTGADLEAVIRTLKSAPPEVITYHPGDKYNTPASLAIMEYVRSTYDRIETIAGIELYRRRKQA